MDDRSSGSVFHDLDIRAGRIAALTPRERDVLAGIVAGYPNKMIAHKLGISARTVEAHRGHIMRYLEASHVAHLICAAMEAIRLGLYPEPASAFAPVFGKPAGQTLDPGKPRPERIGCSPPVGGAKRRAKK